MAKPSGPSQPTSEPAYIVVSSQDQISIGPDNRLQEVKVLYFRTAFGDTGHVTVPKAEFTAEKAQALIEAEVMELIKLRGG